MPDLDAAVVEAPEVEAVETPEVETEPIETPEAIDGEEPVEGDDNEEPAEEDPDAEKDPVAADGRKMPDSLKKALAAVKATNPEAAKELRGLYFSNQEYRNSFPTAAEAANAKNLIEEIGGPEGVQEIAAEREEWGTIDKQFAEGSGDFVKTIAESNPEAFVKIAPHAINEWAARAPEQYAYFAQSLTVNMLKNAGIPEKLERAYRDASDNPALQATIAETYNSIVDMHDKAQQFAQKRPDPREEKLNQDRQQFEQQRRGSFEEGVAKQAETYLTEKMKPEVDRILAGRKIDAEAASTIQNLVTQEVQRRLAEIPGFADKLEAFYRTGDSAKSIEYIKAQYNRILPEATKKVVAPLYRNIQATPAAKPKVAANGAPAARTEVTLRDMPNWNDIDMVRTQQEYGDPTAAVMSGKAILKSGKRASGWM